MTPKKAMPACPFAQRSRESAAAKGARYLAEGRVVVTRVEPGRVTARVRGDGAIHRVSWSPSSGWECSCPARSDRCAHLLAVRSVVAVDVTR